MFNKLSVEFETSEQMDPILVNALLVGLSVTLLTHWLWMRRDIYRFGYQFPRTLWGLPLIGVFLSIGSINKILSFVHHQWKTTKHRTFYGFLAMAPVMVTADPKVIKQILTQSAFVEKARKFYDPVLAAFGGGIVALHAKKSLEQRKVLATAFRPKQLLNFMDTFNVQGEQFVKQMNVWYESNGETTELLDELRLYAINISRITTMGAMPLSSEFGDQIQVLRKCFTFVLNHWFWELIMSCANLKWLIKYNPYNTITKNKLREIAKQTLAYRMENLNKNMKLENYLVIDQGYKYFKSGNMNQDELVAEIGELLMASYETTASTTYSILVMLAMHPEVQDHLHAEIKAIFPNKSLQVKYEHFAQLTYLEMIINETLRLFPPVPMIARESNHAAPIRIDERWYNLPKKVPIVIDIAGLHRDPRNWGPNAHTFNPDNFLRQNVANRDPYAFIPFSKGQRICFGWSYGYMVLKVMLVHILRNFRVSTTLKYEDFGIEMKPFLVHTAEPTIQLHHWF